MRNVLVTGGTGFVGSNLALALLHRGCHVRILRRPNSNLHAIGDADVEHCLGDVRDEASLSRAMKGCDTVFHTAAIVSYWRREREEMYEVNINGTRNIVRACLLHGVEKLVHTSSIAAIGFRRNGGEADEDNEFNWEQYDVGYRISKHRAEQEILRGVKLGLAAVIVNPSVIIGPRDIHFHGGQIVRDVYRKRVFYYIQGGINVVSVEDVVNGHLQAARRGRTGERYILSGENLTHREIFSITAEEVGGIPPFFRLPLIIARTVGVGAEVLGEIAGGRPWITRELLAGAGLFNYYTCRKAEQELRYSHTSFREAVRRTFEWYKLHGYLK